MQMQEEKNLTLTQKKWAKGLSTRKKIYLISSIAALALMVLFFVAFVPATAAIASVALLLVTAVGNLGTTLGLWLKNRSEYKEIESSMDQDNTQKNSNTYSNMPVDLLNNDKKTTVNTQSFTQEQIKQAAEEKMDESLIEKGINPSSFFSYEEKIVRRKPEPPATFTFISN